MKCSLLVFHIYLSGDVNQRMKGILLMVHCHLQLDFIKCNRIPRFIFANLQFAPFIALLQ